MSRVWSPKSQKVHDSLDQDLQVLFTRVRDEVTDISLIYGYRGREIQNELFEAGESQRRWPDSMHNRKPSLACDFQPYPYPQREEVLWGALSYIAGRAYQIAQQEGFRIRWGGDWDGDGDMTDQKFYDLFHIELRR